MLWVAGLVLLLIVGVAAPAEAGDGRTGKGVGIAAHQGAASLAAMPSMRGPARPVQLSKTAAQSPLWGTPAPDSRRELVSATVGLPGLSPERRDRDASPALPWVSQGNSALRLPVTERLSLAIGYRHLEPEDLGRRYAEAGSVDYDSHDFLLRAHWRF
jgi:hypothetical protein